MEQPVINNKPLDTPLPATVKFQIIRTRVMKLRHREGGPALLNSVHRRFYDEG